MSKRTLCLDFDGVIHSYTSGWKAADICDDPVTPGFVQWLIRADLYFTIAIYSSRSHQPGGIAAMQSYVRRAIDNQFDVGFAGDPKDWEYAAGLFNRLQWPTHKPSAFITIDDRALTFTGDWRDFEPRDLGSFQPWNKSETGLPRRWNGSIEVDPQHKSRIRRILTGWRWALSAPWR